MKILNVTPHELNIVTEAGEVTVPASGTVARVEMTSTEAAPIEVGAVAIPVRETRAGAIVDLPPAVAGTVIVAATLVASAATAAGRTDVLAPGALVRDDAGVVVGCQGLSRVR